MASITTLDVPVRPKPRENENERKQYQRHKDYKGEKYHLQMIWFTYKTTDKLLEINGSLTRWWDMILFNVS